MHWTREITQDIHHADKMDDEEVFFKIASAKEAD